MNLLVIPDDGIHPVVAAIRSARRSVRLTIFRCDLPMVEKALADAVARGVLVHALIAHTNRAGEELLRKLELRLLDAGITVSRSADDLVRYHQKFMIVDDRTLFVLGFNLRRAEVQSRRSMGIVTRQRLLVAAAGKLFDADATRQQYSASRNDLVISPDNARARLAKLLRSARSSLRIYDPDAIDRPMLGILAEREKAGVDVRLIGKVGKSGAGLRVGAPKKHRLHLRGILKDERELFIGSQGLRTLELDRRREVGIIVRDRSAIRRFKETFDTDWLATDTGRAEAEKAAAEPAAEESARPRAALRAVAALIVTCLLALASLPARAAETEPRFIDPDAADYRSPRAGEPIRAQFMGRDVEVEARDRRSISAWDIGAAAWSPGPEDRPAVPFGSLYFWRRPDTDQFLRAIVVGLYDDVTYAHSIEHGSPFEWVLGFKNDTIPFGRAEWADGQHIDDEEVVWGSLHGAIGVGYRRQTEAGYGFAFRDDVDPRKPDNQFAASLTVEPGYLYFGTAEDTSDRFVMPQDTFDLQGRLAVKYDALERNLLELPHRGMAFGADGTVGWRANWEDWGIDGREGASRARYPRLLTAYAAVAGGVPGVASERHRLIGSLHAGVGDGLDRFSSPHLGGGPNAMEFGAISRPDLTGAAIDEFKTNQYAIAVAEYRYELFFFTFVGVRAGVSYLNRDVLTHGDVVEREQDVMPSLGGRLTTGFAWKTRLQLDYNYNWDVVRDGNRGGHEIVLHISRSF